MTSANDSAAFTAPWPTSQPPPAFIPLNPLANSNNQHFQSNPTSNSNHDPQSESDPSFLPTGKALTENTTTIKTRPTTPATSNHLPTHLYSSLPPHLLQPDGTPDYLRMILSADIYSLVKTTPLTPASNLSAKLGCEILLKREDLQPVFSFKLRGAYNMMRQLEGEQKWKGVIACSAGESLSQGRR